MGWANYQIALIFGQQIALSSHRRQFHQSALSLLNTLQNYFPEAYSAMGNMSNSVMGLSTFLASNAALTWMSKWYPSRCLDPKAPNELKDLLAAAGLDEVVGLWIMVQIIEI